MQPANPAVKTRRIYQHPPLTNALTQLSGAVMEWEVPLLPPLTGFKNYKGTPEQLAAYLRNQGLLAGETAALVAAIAADGALVYQASKGLTQAHLDGLSLAITTAAGTNVILPTTVHVPFASLGAGTTYDSATGWLYAVLPAGTDPANVLSVYLSRPAGGQEHVLASDLNPFGGTVTPPTPAQPAAPTNLHQTASTSSTITLAWDAAAGTYTLQRAPVTSGVVGTYATVYSGTSPSYQNTGLTYLTTYAYRVLVTVSGVASGYSTVAQVSTTAAPVTPVTYDTTLLIPAGGPSQAAHGMRLVAPAGDKIRFNRLAGAISPPEHVYLNGAAPSANRELTFIDLYAGEPFEYETAAGVIYSNNTFQTAASGLILS